MVALFIDTNILLHFQTFDEVDWSKIVDGDYELQIAPVILDELDKHKNNQNNKTAQRAKMIAGKFEQIMDGVTGKVPLHFIIHRPPSDFFEPYQLDPKQQDDCLLAAILQYRSNHADMEIRLVSDDLGIKLKGKTLDINICKPSKELRLPETPDKDQKEIERLQKQLATLQLRVPKVTIAFENRMVPYKHQIKSNVKTLNEYKAEEMLKIKREHSIMAMKTENPNPKNLMEMLNTTEGIWGLSNERRHDYNNKLAEFYRNYEQYLTKKYAWAIRRLMSFHLTFYLFNDGSVPATDIDVWLHLPDGFSVEKKQEKEPIEPAAPYRPKNNYDYGSFSVGMPDLLESVMPVNRIPIINPDKPEIRKTNSYEVTYHTASLKHGLHRQFDPIILQYERFDDMKSFTIDYKLHISNVPEPVVGKLHVVIELLE